MLSDGTKQLLDVFPSLGWGLHEIVELIVLYVVFSLGSWHLSHLFQVNSVSYHVDKYVLVCVVLNLLYPVAYVVEAASPMARIIS